jgi:flagellar biosynthesis/type III secretory pathway protein FliH
MCKAIDDLVEDGRLRGVEQGLERGMAQGLERGMIQGKMDTLCSLVKEGLIRIEDAAKRVGLSETAFREEMNRM